MDDKLRELDGVYNALRNEKTKLILQRHDGEIPLEYGRAMIDQIQNRQDYIVILKNNMLEGRVDWEKIDLSKDRKIGDLILTPQTPDPEVIMRHPQWAQNVIVKEAIKDLSREVSAMIQNPPDRPLPALPIEYEEEGDLNYLFEDENPLFGGGGEHENSSLPLEKEYNPMGAIDYLQYSDIPYTPNAINNDADLFDNYLVNTANRFDAIRGPGQSYEEDPEPIDLGESNPNLSLRNPFEEVFQDPAAHSGSIFGDFEAPEFSADFGENAAIAALVTGTAIAGLGAAYTSYKHLGGKEKVKSAYRWLKRRLNPHHNSDTNTEAAPPPPAPAVAGHSQGVRPGPTQGGAARDGDGHGSVGQNDMEIVPMTNLKEDVEMKTAGSLQGGSGGGEEGEGNKDEMKLIAAYDNRKGKMSSLWESKKNKNGKTSKRSKYMKHRAKDNSWKRVTRTKRIQYMARGRKGYKPRMKKHWGKSMKEVKPKWSSKTSLANQVAAHKLNYARNVRLANQGQAVLKTLKK